MFHMLAYEEDVGASTVTELDGVPDQIFQIRTSGFFFFEQWKLIANAFQATSAVRARLNMPMVNALNRHHIYPIIRGATIPADPRIQDLRDMPMDIPVNEEMLWEAFTDQAMGNEQSRVFNWVAGPNWTRQTPAYLQRLTVRATGAAAGTANAWGTDGAITLADQDLRSGVYSLIGAQCFDAGTVAFRFIFPSQPTVQGKQLRPGGLGLEALANGPNPIFSGGLGEWGRFHNLELPRIQIFANATAASTQELRLDLLYLGNDKRLLELTS